MKSSSLTFDVEDVDFAFDDQPDLHAVLAQLRERKPYAVVPFAGVPAVLLLTDELVRADAPGAPPIEVSIALPAKADC